jgi:hypothetical protein
MNIFLDYIDNCKEIRSILLEIKNNNNITTKHECISLIELVHNVKFSIFNELLSELESILIIPFQLMIKTKNEMKYPFPNYRQVYYYCIGHSDDDDCKRWMCVSKLNVDCDKMIKLMDDELFRDYNRIVDSINNYKK